MKWPLGLNHSHCSLGNGSTVPSSRPEAASQKRRMPLGMFSQVTRLRLSGDQDTGCGSLMNVNGMDRTGRPESASRSRNTYTPLGIKSRAPEAKVLPSGERISWNNGPVWSSNASSCCPLGVSMYDRMPFAVPTASVWLSRSQAKAFTAPNFKGCRIGSPVCPFHRLTVPSRLGRDPKPCHAATALTSCFPCTCAAVGGVGAGASGEIVGADHSHVRLASRVMLRWTSAN